MEIDNLDFKSLNQKGLIPGVNESEEEFKTRVEFLNSWSDTLVHEDLTLAESKLVLKKENRLSEEELEEASQRSKDLFNISPSWVPAYYQSNGLPMMSGGMAVHYQESKDSSWKSFFQLKGVFRHQKKWLLYTADEIISHEMCHIARAALNANRYEETIAYMTSSSSFRRKLGGALVNHYDSMIFLGSVFTVFCFDFLSYILAIASLHWIGKFIFLFILIAGFLRNFNIRREFKKAQNKLKEIFKDQCLEVLFRLNDQEIKFISESSIEEIIHWWYKQENFRGNFLKSIYHINS